MKDVPAQTKPNVFDLADGSFNAKVFDRITALEKELVALQEKLRKEVIAHHNAQSTVAKFREVLEWIHMGSICADAASAKGDCPICKILKATEGGKGATCSFCHWTNVGCINISDPGGEQIWVCPGCVKRTMAPANNPNP